MSLLKGWIVIDDVMNKVMVKFVCVRFLFKLFKI